MTVHYRSAAVAGVQVAYREAGNAANPPLLLLHGFPASSFSYRHLMTALADRFHLIAPDYPGFGNSPAPNPDAWPYTFDHLADTVEGLVDHLGLSHFGLYMHDYGAPVGFRLALRRPIAVDFLVIQNGNAYEEGFTGVWDGMRNALWQNRSPETEKPLHAFFEPDGIKWIYTGGTRDPERISPDNWNLDLAVLAKPNARRINLDLFYDYRTNAELYPVWQEYLRRHEPATLIVWGANDPIFRSEGAEAYLRDVPHAELHFLDSGHFALEDHGEEIAGLIRAFHTTRVARAVSSAA
ncbi:MAG TPA: alpha/beta hydrolase [Nocardioidaceae bacterium]|jgi:pimeloyl-ACP methyl ester carboxylesterase